MAVQCVLVGKGKDDVFTAVYGETTFDKVVKAYNENKVVQMIYQNRVYYLDNATVINSPEAFSFISTFSNQNDENGEIKHWVITLMSGDNWSGPFLQKSTPAIHAKTHAKNGTDPLAPADIGAMELSENVLKQSNEDITSQVAQVLSGDLVPFSGGTMTGLLNVLTPVGDSNATTKKYVDDALSKKIGMDGIGDLHVWKKTVVTGLAGYDLGPVESGFLASGSNANSNNSRVMFSYSSAISVSDAGAVTLVSPSNVTYTYNSDSSSTIQNAIRGKFVSITPLHNSGYYSEGKEDVWFIPSDATVSYITNGTRLGYPYNYCYVVDKMQRVRSHGIATTTTYPVSTNRNAYQEGSDAKPAGVYVGDVVTGTFQFAANSNYSVWYKVSDSLNATDDGTVSLGVYERVSMHGGTSYSSSAVAGLKGKFIQLESSNYAGYVGYPFNNLGIYYIPADAVFSSGPNVDRYQPVTGYPSIPANTTIEYLGCLGEKTRMQVVSYVGTGTYGVSNPCSLTFDFPPKVVMFLYRHDYSGGYYYRFMHTSVSYLIYDRDNVVCNTLSTEYKQGQGFGYVSSSQYGKISGDKRTIYWYCSNMEDQANSTGYTYYYLAIG